jgi:hypothetical protein
MKEHDCVVLMKDMPEHGLLAGDIGIIVHIHGQGEAYEVEFMTLAGATVAIATLLSTEVRPVNPRDLAHTRELEAAA